ncbi:MAG: tetratricopeptide repeat protein [Terracidiphilus sp.]
MMHHQYCARRRSNALAISAIVALAVSHPLWSATCVAPTRLEARVHSHPDAEAYTALGIWFGDNHKSACAAQAFQAGIRLEPGSPRLNYLLGLSLYTAGELEKSVVPLRRSVELDPKNEKAHLLLASALTGLGQSKDAFTEWQAVLRINPESKMALDGIAKILMAAGDNESVIAQLQGMQLDENLTLDLATAYGNTGEFDNAADTLNKGLKAYQSSVPLTSSLVSVYVKQVRLEEAEKIADQLARRNPQDIEAQRVYLQVLVFDAKNQTAMPLARKLLARAPHDADFLYLNGVLERTAGDLDSARKHLEQAASLDPNRYSTRFNLGFTLEQLHDDAGAKVQLQRAIELDPTEPQCHFELAKVLRKLGENAAAQEQLALYQKQVKEQTDQSIAAQKSTQAVEAMRAGDKQKAAALYREAIAVLPDNAGLLYRLAGVLNDLEDWKGERSALDQAVNVDPNFALAHYQLAYLDSHEGNLDSAEQHLRLAIQASPGYVQAWVALATTLAMESRFSDAQHALDSALNISPNNTEALELRKKLSDRQEQH